MGTRGTFARCTTTTATATATADSSCRIMTSLDFWKHRKPASAPTAFPGADALRIGIVHARWNAAVVDALVGAAIDTLLAAGVAHDHIVVESVPGSWELPFGAMRRVCSHRCRPRTPLFTRMRARGGPTAPTRLLC